jgi:hypothetical protein
MDRHSVITLTPTMHDTKLGRDLRDILLALGGAPEQPGSWRQGNFEPYSFGRCFSTSTQTLRLPPM